MKRLERRQWHCSSVFIVNYVFIVNCRHVSNFVLIFDFEQANVYWVHIERTKHFRSILLYY